MCFCYVPACCMCMYVYVHGDVLCLLAISSCWPTTSLSGGAFAWYEWLLVSMVPRASFSGAFAWCEWLLVSTVPRASFSGAFAWCEWLLVSTVPRASLVRPRIVWRSRSRSALGWFYT